MLLIIETKLKFTFKNLVLLKKETKLQCICCYIPVNKFASPILSPFLLPLSGCLSLGWSTLISTNVSNKSLVLPALICTVGMYT